MSIFVSGSLAYDIILDYPGRFADHIEPSKVHALSLSFQVSSVKKSIGGTAGNICYNLAMPGMPGMPVEILAAIGFDGDEILSKLTQLRIKRYYLRRAKIPTAAAYIMTDRDDNQITAFYPGAMTTRVKMPKVRSRDWAIIAAESPANMTRLARHYQKHEVKYIFDPGQAITALSKMQMQFCVRGAAILIGNDYEIEFVSRQLSLREGTPTKQSKQRLLRDYARNDHAFIIIRTLGAGGSEIIYPNGNKIKIGIARVKKAVDPTGAGDAYRAGLICGIMKGFDLKRSAQLGATAASFAVEKHGTQNHRFDYETLLARHNRDFADKINE